MGKNTVPDTRVNNIALDRRDNWRNMFMNKIRYIIDRRHFRFERQNSFMNLFCCNITTRQTYSLDAAHELRGQNQPVECYCTKEEATDEK